MCMSTTKLKPIILLYAAYHNDLLRSQALHVGGAEDVVEVLVQISDVGVHRHLQQRQFIQYHLIFS